jgi:putative sugar O-methyltransferase
MFKQQYPIAYPQRRQLSEFMASALYLENNGSRFEKSDMWETLTAGTFTAVNGSSVMLNSGHNFTKPSNKVPLIDPFLKIISKSYFAAKSVSKVSRFFIKIAERINDLHKADITKKHKLLYEDPYIKDHIALTPYLEKAILYNSSNIWTAVESLSFIKRAITDSPKKRENLSFFEIGAGAGMTSLGCLEIFPGARVMICDLPQTIAITYTLITFFTESKVKMALPNEIQDLSKKNDYDLIFITPSQIDMVKDKSCDVFINSGSMQEMERPTVNNYFKEIRRLGSKDSIFFFKNLERSLQGYINLDEYPWNVLGDTIYEGIAPYTSSQLCNTRGIKNIAKIVKVN